jgi:hypothetical protein
MVLSGDGTFIVGNEATADWKLLGNRLIFQARSGGKSNGDCPCEVERWGGGRIRAAGPEGSSPCWCDAPASDGRERSTDVRCDKEL